MLWQEFAWHTRRLDVEALEALLSRDRLEMLALDQEELETLQNLDTEVLRSAASIRTELELTGAMVAIRNRREREARVAFWWWLDRVASGFHT